MNAHDQVSHQRQSAILKFIHTFIKKKGYPPSRREIEAALELSSTSTELCLQELKKQGSLEFDRNKYRGLRLTRKAAPSRNLQIPLLGIIQAGAGSESPISPRKVMEVPPSLLPPQVDRSRLFARKVQGNGLATMLILDGDIAILESIPEDEGSLSLPLQDGEIVAVCLPAHDGTVLARRVQEKTGWHLEPADGGAEPFLMKQDMLPEVEGRLVAVIRSFGN